MMVTDEEAPVTTQDRTARLLAAVDTYVDALHTCDVDKLDEVFHPSASLFDVDGGEVLLPVVEGVHEDLATVDVDTRPSPASVGQAQQARVLSVDWLWERAAVVRVELWILDTLFRDHLCFVDGPDGFRIVAKVWHDATGDLPRPTSRDATS